MFYFKQLRVSKLIAEDISIIYIFCNIYKWRLSIYCIMVILHNYYHTTLVNFTNDSFIISSCQISIIHSYPDSVFLLTSTPISSSNSSIFSSSKISESFFSLDLISLSRFLRFFFSSIMSLARDCEFSWMFNSAMTDFSFSFVNVLLVGITSLSSSIQQHMQSLVVICTLPITVTLSS